ncbi:MAG: glutaredoxin family protein [Euryarchaeota archaeon]|nr:glutaredoxin family protein [Euryarchaeota archaeon]
MPPSHSGPMAGGEPGHPRAPLPVRLYTKPGCPLCLETERALSHWGPRMGLQVETVDITRDPVLRVKYGRYIPVVEVRGEVVSRAGTPEARLERRLEEMAGIRERKITAIFSGRG